MVKSALLLRAIEDVKRIWRIRDDKAALTSLHTRGLLGDDTKARFEHAEKELEAEILDVVQEANSFKQGWGGLIFATATEMAQAERTRETVLGIPRIRQREGESGYPACEREDRLRADKLASASVIIFVLAWTKRTELTSAEKRLALRRKYLPESDPSITPAPTAAQIAAASASASSSTSGTSTPAKEAVAPPAPAQVTAIEKEGSATSAQTASPQAAGTSTGSGTNSGASTPSKVSEPSVLRSKPGS
jgi:translocation protein SEC66